MRLHAPEGSIVRLGPGVFRTRGRGGNGYVMPQSKRWQPLSGQKLIGAGMFSTTVLFDFDLFSSDSPPVIDENAQPGQRQFMINNDEVGSYLSSFEISDLTLDCNLQHIPEPFGPTLESGTVTASTSGAGVAATAGFFKPEMVGSTIRFSSGPEGTILSFQNDQQVTLLLPVNVPTSVPFKIFGFRLSITAAFLTGSNVRLRRVRLINFGTQTPLYFDGHAEASGQSKSAEGFPLRIEGRTVNRAVIDGGDVPAFNSWMEDCIVEQPYVSSGREVTFVVGGGVATNANPATSKLHIEPFGCGMRRFYMNFDFINPLPGRAIEIESFSIGSLSSENITVTTRFPHRLYPGDFVEFTGGGVAGWNNRRFTVGTVSGSPRWAERTFKLAVEDPPSAPTLPMQVFSNPPQTMPASLSRSGTTVTVTTAKRHWRLAGDWIVISGANQPEYNGTFQVMSTDLTDTQFKYTISGSPGTPSGDIWLDRRPNKHIRVRSVTRDTGTAWPPTAVFETYDPHYRKPGEWINLWNSMLTLTSDDPPVATDQNSYNNHVEITEVLGPRHVRCRLPGDKVIGTAGTPNYQIAVQNAGFWMNYQATYVNGGFGGGVFGNRIVGAYRGAYHDYYWHRHLILRKNYFFDANHGVVFAVEAGAHYGTGDPPALSAYLIGKVKAASGSEFVRVRLDAAGADPAYLPGLAMQVVRTGFDPVNVVLTWVGWHIDSQTGSRYYEIEFRKPVSPAFPNDAAVICNLWFQQSLFQIEDNIFELRLASLGWVAPGQVGIAPRGPVWEDLSVPASPYSFNPVKGLEEGWVVLRAILRENIIRKTDGGSDPQQPNLEPQTQSYGIRVNSAEHLIVENNIIDELNNPVLQWNRIPQELAYSDSVRVQSFNNQYMTGKLRQLFNDPSWRGNADFWVEELGTYREDWLLFVKNKNWIF